MLRNSERQIERSGSVRFVDPSTQTGRQLSEVEVNQISFIIKKHAYRYIGAAKEEWLYPEPRIPSEHWRQLDDQYFLMPAPRSVTILKKLSLAIIIALPISPSSA